VPVLCQYLLVWELLRTVILNPLQSDRFIWRWSPDGKYSASSAYRAFFVGSSSLFFFLEQWKTKAKGAMENKGHPLKSSFSFGSHFIVDYRLLIGARGEVSSPG
jgi:hypothetical protein